MIAEAVHAGIQAGLAQAAHAPKDAYKAAERRLYALPVLERKAACDKERLAEIRAQGAAARSRSLVRFQRGGYRLSPEDMHEAVMRDMEASIAADEHEIGEVRRALGEIAGDPYYLAVEGRYLLSMDDEAIAALVPCDPVTVWRNRRRLVQTVAVLLYGAAAL